MGVSVQAVLSKSNCDFHIRVLFLGFADLEEKFQEVFERFETLEKDELSCPVTSETSIEEEEPVRCDAEKEHNLDFFVI